MCYSWVWKMKMKLMQWRGRLVVDISRYKRSIAAVKTERRIRMGGKEEWKIVRVANMGGVVGHMHWAEVRAIFEEQGKYQVSDAYNASPASSLHMFEQVTGLNALGQPVGACKMQWMTFVGQANFLVWLAETRKLSIVPEVLLQLLEMIERKKTSDEDDSSSKFYRHASSWLRRRACAGALDASNGFDCDVKISFEVEDASWETWLASLLEVDLHPPPGSLDSSQPADNDSYSSDQRLIRKQFVDKCCTIMRTGQILPRSTWQEAIYLQDPLACLQVFRSEQLDDVDLRLFVMSIDWTELTLPVLTEVVGLLADRLLALQHAPASRSLHAAMIQVFQSAPLALLVTHLFCPLMLLGSSLSTFQAECIRRLLSDPTLEGVGSSSSSVSTCSTALLEAWLKEQATWKDDPTILGSASFLSVLETLVGRAEAGEWLATFVWMLEVLSSPSLAKQPKFQKLLLATATNFSEATMEVYWPRLLVLAKAGSGFMCIATCRKIESLLQSKREQAS